MNQKYTILLNVNSPQINLQIQHCPNKNDRGFYCRYCQANYKIYIEKKKQTKKTKGKKCLGTNAI